MVLIFSVIHYRYRHLLPPNKWSISLVEIIFSSWGGNSGTDGKDACLSAYFACTDIFNKIMDQAGEINVSNTIFILHYRRKEKKTT